MSSKNMTACIACLTLPIDVQALPLVFCCTSSSSSVVWTSAGIHVLQVSPSLSTKSCAYAHSHHHMINTCRSSAGCRKMLLLTNTPSVPLLPLLCPMSPFLPTLRLPVVVRSTSTSQVILDPYTTVRLFTSLCSSHHLPSPPCTSPAVPSSAPFHCPDAAADPIHEPSPAQPASSCTKTGFWSQVTGDLQYCAEHACRSFLSVKYSSNMRLSVCILHAAIAKCLSTSF